MRNFPYIARTHGELYSTQTEEHTKLKETCARMILQRVIYVRDDYIMMCSWWRIDSIHTDTHTKCDIMRGYWAAPTTVIYTARVRPSPRRERSAHSFRREDLLWWAHKTRDYARAVDAVRAPLYARDQTDCADNMCVSAA